MMKKYSADKYLTHSSINSIFLEIDKNPEIMKIYLGKWLAWPLVKASLWQSMLESATVPVKRTGSYFTVLQIVVRLVTGLLEILVNLIFPKASRIAVLYSPRSMKLYNRDEIHPHLGTFLTSRSDLLECIYEWGRMNTKGSLHAGKLRLYSSGVLIYAISRFWRYSPNVRKAARELADILAPYLINLHKDNVNILCLNNLAWFVVREKVYGYLFRRAGIKTMLVADPDSKCGEVAAAKSLGIRVIEFQHGMFGATEPDYSWTDQHKTMQSSMTVPDSILVFGPLWRNAILQNGFWKDEDIINLGNAAICSSYDEGKPHQKIHSPVKIVFPTQFYVQQESIDFWTKVLQKQQSFNEKLFYLEISLHPLERNSLDIYEQLVRKFPEDCRFVDHAKDGVNAVLNADVVAGYTSFMLLEAIGVQRFALSLRAKSAPEGLAGTFEMNNIDEYVPLVSTSDEFFTILKKLIDEDSADKGVGKNFPPKEIFYFPNDGFDSHLQSVVSKIYE